MYINSQHSVSFLSGDQAWKSIQQQKKKIGNNGSIISDVIDGRQYIKLCEKDGFLSMTTNLSAIFNTDGVALYKSSRTEVWPIYLAINEIPPDKR